MNDKHGNKSFKEEVVDSIMSEQAKTLMLNLDETNVTIMVFKPDSLTIKFVISSRDDAQKSENAFVDVGFNKFIFDDLRELTERHCILKVKENDREQRYALTRIGHQMAGLIKQTK